MKNFPKLIIFLIASIVLLIFLTRLFLPTQIDDVSPKISCEYELEKYSPEVLYVIPKYQNFPISENKTWCNKIKSLNKTLALHGYNHEYKEFKKENAPENLKEAIQIFKDCFNQTPENFKPPHLAISKENKKEVKEYGLNLDLYFNQLFHKAYHCNDSGVFKNKLIKVF